MHKLLKYRLGTRIWPCRFFSQEAPTQKYGQPTPWTHPYLLKENEVNVGISQSEFMSRRDKLVESILKTGGVPTSNRHLIILPSARKQFMVDHIPYFFRQDTDFRYLTGCLQPECSLVIEFSGEKSKSTLFMKENTAYEEKWEGTRFGFREAKEFFRVDEVVANNSFNEYIHRYSSEKEAFTLWYDLMDPRDAESHQLINSFILNAKKRHPSLTVEAVRPVLHELRSIKSPAEINLMRKTCQIGAQALRKTISKSRSMKTELEFQARVEFESKSRGASYLAYPPVVAAGNNATTIHYIDAGQSVEDGDMMLMDAGCEYHGYASDITRTWPVSGKFTDAQLTLYHVVLDCQEQLIQSIKPNQTSIQQLYSAMQIILAKNLREAGLISGEHDDKMALRMAYQFCPHNVGHHLGMDVHDCGSVNKGQPLLPGNVITIEPGIYIPSSNTSVPAEYRGIGIRIEDNILINQTGCEVLSRECPKSSQEIQDLIY